MRESDNLIKTSGTFSSVAAPCGAASGNGTPHNAICVLGMHRGGTSATAGLLRLLGVDLGADLMPSGSDNKKGFWEHAYIVCVHLGLMHSVGTYDNDFLPLMDGWENHPQVMPYRNDLVEKLTAEFGDRPLWGFKDPRTCRLTAMWNIIFREMNVRPNYLLLVRNPNEVAASMWSRQGMQYNQSLLLWLGHMLEAERHSRKSVRVIVGYDSVMGDWRREAAKIGRGFGLEWPNSLESIQSEVGAFLDPKLQHHRYDASEFSGPEMARTMTQAAIDRGGDRRIAGWVFGVYQALAAGVASAESRINFAVLDAIGAEFNRAIPALMPWRMPKPLTKLSNTYKGASGMLNRVSRSG